MASLDWLDYGHSLLVELAVMLRYLSKSIPKMELSNGLMIIGVNTSLHWLVLLVHRIIMSANSIQQTLGWYYSTNSQQRKTTGMLYVVKPHSSKVEFNGVATVGLALLLLVRGVKTMSLGKVLHGEMEKE
jgi:hydrogenase-4 membrane subunit HyfE